MIQSDWGGNMKAIEVENLTKSYNNFKAVDELSFEVHRWEIFGFLGPNGAGKTTTILSMLGLIIPDRAKGLQCSSAFTLSFFFCSLTL